MIDAIPVLIVAFRNAPDVSRCLRALARLAATPAFAVFVCENGGAAAYDAMLAALTAPDGPCAFEVATEPPPRLCRATRLLLRRDGAPPVRVHVGEARGNLGYAGGVNAWMAALRTGQEAWPGIWILNPDTEPAPDALAALVAHAEATGRGLVGSQLVALGHPETPVACGLAWRRLRAATRNVCDRDPERVQRRMQAPSGASVFATRACLQRIGPMWEDYFLYFEDLDWGVQAGRTCGVGYEPRSVVAHDFGTTIGSATSRRRQSPLSVYLDFRNRLLFVRRNFPGWTVWTAFVEVLESAEYCRVLAWRNAGAALRGLVAGVRGQGGRPDAMLARHRAPRGAPFEEGWAKGAAKLLLSLGYYAVRAALGRIGAALGLSARSRLCILYYHGVRDSQAASFARQMAALSRWAQVVPADWRGAVGGSTGRPAVALTFDDAFECLHRNALPILRQLDMPCTIFVPTAYLGQAPGWRMETTADQHECVMSAARLQEVAGPLVAIGSHTATHPHLTALTPEAAQLELTESRDALEALLEQQIRLLAFPYGDRNMALAALCQRAGYAQVFTIEPTLVRPEAAAFVRGRVAVDPEDGPLTFYLKAHGAYAWMARASAVKRALRRRLRPAAAPWYATPDKAA